MVAEHEDANMLPVYYIFPTNSTWCSKSTINERAIVKSWDPMLYYQQKQ